MTTKLKEAAREFREARRALNLAVQEVTQNRVDLEAREAWERKCRDRVYEARDKLAEVAAEDSK